MKKSLRENFVQWTLFELCAENFVFCAVVVAKPYIFQESWKQWLGETKLTFSYTGEIR